MKAIFLGSISVMVDTSDLQRAAFNAAFKEAGLDWQWTKAGYATMLEQSGGRDRIAAFADQRGETVDAGALHQRKSEIFQEALRSGPLPLRPVTAALLEKARAEGLKLAFVSGTSRANLDALLTGLGGAQALGLDLVTSAEMARAPKPDPSLYMTALKTLGLAAADVLAVEDNIAGVAAAQAAGIPVKAYPNSNTLGHDFGDVEIFYDTHAAQAA